MKTCPECGSHKVNSWEFVHDFCRNCKCYFLNEDYPYEKIQ